MTEQQEFELVARAVGIELVRDPDGILRDCTGSHPLMNIFACPVWNPKTDDGDSRRLATALYLVVASMQATHEKPAFTAVYHFNGPEHASKPHGKDPNAATRLAVWKVALEIAKGMK